MGARSPPPCFLTRVLRGRPRSLRFASVPVCYPPYAHWPHPLLSLAPSCRLRVRLRPRIGSSVPLFSLASPASVSRHTLLVCPLPSAPVLHAHHSQLHLPGKFRCLGPPAVFSGPLGTVGPEHVNLQTNRVTHRSHGGGAHKGAAFTDKTDPGGAPRLSPLGIDRFTWPSRRDPPFGGGVARPQQRRTRDASCPQHGGSDARHR